MRDRRADRASTAVVYGIGVAGEATARAFARRGHRVRIGDDAPSAAHLDLARDIGADVVTIESSSAIAAALDGADVLVPAPGIPPRHRLIEAARAEGVAVRSEIDIAYEWEQTRAGGPRPVLAVTGTDGKTTTTMMTGAMLRAAGRTVAEVGNTERPFIDALDDDVEVFVVECSSFRLEFTEVFRAEAATCLNIAHDHIDWHGSFESYAASKAKLWSNARSGDVAIVPAADDLVRSTLSGFPGRVVTFGTPTADYRIDSGRMSSPHGLIIEAERMRRSMPHDLFDAMAAAALVLESGLAGADNVARALEVFEPAPHRLQHLGRVAGHDWYDDSKATSPHAALNAIRAFDRLVLIAGGRNKDLALEEMASEPSRLAAAVVIGESAERLASALEEACPVRRADTMDAAVRLALDAAPAGVPIVLSPGCTSYDWYRNYGERGDDFQRCVRELAAAREVCA